MPQSDIFTSLRAALETTRGTAVNPTRILEQTDFSHSPDVATIRPMERRGSYFAFYRSVAGREQHSVEFNSNLSYQQAAWLGNLFVKSVTTGAGYPAVNIASVSTANPGVVTTSTAHGLTSGQSTTIAGTTTTPTINGVQVATVISPTTFSVPVNVTSGQAGAGGTSTQVSTSEKVYAFTPSSATDDLKSATLEWGYDTTLSGTQPGFRLPFVVGDELTLNFDKASADGVTFAAQMHSPKAVSQITSFGGTPSALTTNAITPTTVQVYIDSTTTGATADNYVTNAEWTLSNEWTDLDTLNLTTAAQDTFRVGARAWTLSCQRYKINDTELDAYNAKTVRKVRIKSTGPALGSSFYSLTLDLYGVWSSYSNDSVDGLAMESLTLEPVYDTTAATDFALTVVDNTTTIT